MHPRPPRRAASASAAWLVLGVAACLSADAAPEPAPAPPPPHAALTPDIAADQFLTRDAYLSSDELRGRESGTPGGAAAEEYVASELARFGLAPAGEAGTPYQTVAMPWRPVIEEDCSFRILRGDDAPVTLTPLQGAVPFTTSKAGEVEAGVVFAGYGLSDPEHGYDDWAGLDAAGKIAIVLRHGPREERKDSPWFLRTRDAGRMQSMSFDEKARRAAAAGAVAVVFVNDRHHKDQGLPTTSGGAELPIPAFAIPRDAANRIVRSAGKELSDFEGAIDRDLAPRSQDVPGVRVALRVTLGSATARNALFLLEGSDPKLRDEVVVVSAHMDHVGLGWFGSVSNSRGEVHNGADDNASGTAAMLEVAENMAAGPRPRRSILFAGWCGEEKGLVGSEHWCTHPTIDLGRVVANVNLDMVGRYRDAKDDDPGLQVVGAPTGGGLTEKTDAAGKDLGLRVRHSWDAWEQSDHFSLYRRKIPVLFLHTGLHGDYHRPADDWWKVDGTDGARIARFTVEVVRGIADDDARPAFHAKPARPVLGVTLGDDENGGGAAIGQVFPGLAAANAGIQPGDVIVEADGQKVRGAGELMKVVGAHKPGDEIDVVFRRKGKDTKTRVKLSAR